MGQLLISLIVLLIGLSLGLVGRRPFANVYFPLLWYGQIFLIDGLVFLRTGRSLWRDHRKLFLVAIPLSSIFWWLFEGINVFVENWYYLGRELYNDLEWTVLASLSFSTMVLAIFEMAMLVGSFSWFKQWRGPVISLPANLKKAMVVLGLISLGLTLRFPRIFFPLVWLSPTLILDPINYFRGRSSILGFLEKGNWRLPAAIYIGTTLTGFLWEFYHLWTFPHWEYTIPYFDFWRVLNVPFLGYFAYGPLGLEIFALWNLTRSILPFPWLTLSFLDKD